MVGQKTENFQVIGIEEIIETLPMVCHEDTENPKYALVWDCDEPNAKRSLVFLGILNIYELGPKCTHNYMGYLKDVENNACRGVVFTDNKDRIGIFHRPQTGKIEEDYTLIFRNNDELLFRGNVIPGKGYSNESKIQLNPGQRFDWRSLNHTDKKISQSQADLIALLSGYNPNFRHN